MMTADIAAAAKNSRTGGSSGTGRGASVRPSTRSSMTASSAG